MNSKRLWITTATIFSLSVFGSRPSGVWAQSEQAVCHAGWEWNKNTIGQDPCLISSMLDAACRGIGLYTVPPVNATQNYSPPQRDSTSDLRCDCDSVMYSLYMGCTTCQGGRIFSWGRWIGQCDEVHVAEYPYDVPLGTAIPRWAFFNITSLPSQTYNDTVAMTVGRDPEATPKIASTNSGKPGPTKSGDSSGGGSKTGAIVGGVVGGIVSLAILVVGAFWYLRRRKRGGGNPVSEYEKGQPMLPSLSPAAAPLPSYNPDDPSTYPPPIHDGQSPSTYVAPLSPIRGPHGQGPYSDISQP